VNIRLSPQRRAARVIVEIVVTLIGIALLVGALGVNTWNHRPPFHPRYTIPIFRATAVPSSLYDTDDP
jgi:hypothetical protein